MSWQNKVFEKYKKNYDEILNVIYPAKNSTGFPERNLSVNFAKAYESIFDNSVTWYELQFGINNNSHIDAVIIDTRNKRILFIESKRFSNPSKKVNEINEDIDRIICLKEELLNDSDERINDIKSYHFYGVILADVWLETKTKNEIYNAFKDGTYINQKYPHIELHELYYDVREFDNDKICNYKLVSFSWELA